MEFRDITAAAKILACTLVFVSLGSCAVVQISDNRINMYSFELSTGKKHCSAFVRQAHVGHSKPVAPSINPDKLDPEELAEVALTHAEKLEKYIEDENRFMAEDVVRHISTCD